MKSLLRERDAELLQARAKASNADALIAHLQLAIEKLRRELYGVRSERKARLLEQMELELEELEADASEDELAAEERRRRRPRSAPSPQEAVAPAFPGASAARARRAAGADLMRLLRLDAASKLGEDVTETLEVDPAAMEGRPARAREVHLPRVREDQPAAGAVPSAAARACWARACWR